MLFSDAVCERHFRPECIEEKWTEERAKNQLRLIRRVKKDAVPTEFLNIPQKRKYNVSQQIEKVSDKRYLLYYYS